MNHFVVIESKVNSPTFRPVGVLFYNEEGLLTRSDTDIPNCNCGVRSLIEQLAETKTLDEVMRRIESPANLLSRARFVEPIPYVDSEDKIADICLAGPEPISEGEFTGTKSR